jgi:predicted ATP-dependent Lon-type protease
MSCIINGSAGLTTNSGAVYDGISRGTSVTASGTSVDFTSIPSWVKKITVMFSGVSTSGTALPRVQIGSGSITTSGYVGSTSAITASAAASLAITSGFDYYSNAAAYIIDGVMTITNLSSNIWICSGSGDYAASLTGTMLVSGRVTLSGTLDRIRLTTANGTDTFDAGSINILFE